MPAGEGPAERRLRGVTQGAADVADALSLAQLARGDAESPLGEVAERCLSDQGREPLGEP